MIKLMKPWTAVIVTLVSTLMTISLVYEPLSQ